MGGRGRGEWRGEEGLARRRPSDEHPGAGAGSRWIIGQTAGLDEFVPHPWKTSRIWRSRLIWFSSKSELREVYKSNHDYQRPSPSVPPNMFALSREQLRSQDKHGLH
jgi:hypothetical protein